MDYHTELHKKETKIHKGFLHAPLRILCSFLCKNLLLLLFTIIFLNIQTVSAQNRNFNVELGGYLKELGQLSLDNAISKVRYDNILHHRLESDWTLSEHLEFRADLRTRLLHGYSIEHTPGLNELYEQDPNFMDLSWVWHSGDRSVLHSSIDRLHASYINGPFEVHVGRQRLNWGRTYVWNPNDLFNAYSYLNFDYEERPGVDAISAGYSWSYASGVEVGYRAGDSFEESVIGGMLRTSLASYDVQFIGGHYLEHTVLGVGWAGYLSSAGFKGEITYFHPEDRFFEDTGHFTATAGIDYMLPSGLYLQGELLYNGGFQRQSGALQELTQPPSADNLFIARSGFFLNSSYQLHPLVSGNLGVMSSFDRSIFIFIPQLSYSVSENVDFLVLSQLLKGSILRNVTDTPNLFFFRLKWSY
ncbi:hypothetical protein NC796_25175 [Aliifodinibius sp. S!AR15-10]|uniref:hypothetical protein n=1 Tax=Aliifodinibius sp. S!AR15-10 TaxID=2950437 RepID=UPI0028637EAE|nr:hypothetical protein [Aliifodinibius sp. S!AR15-10]MDR8394463.1 hypothetical protein [Aliifodinibius sp. S!AR15-10]